MAQRTRDEERALQNRILAEVGFSYHTSNMAVISDDECIADAQRIQSHPKKTAGIRALKAKYGRDGAESILLRKTGRTIHLQ